MKRFLFFFFGMWGQLIFFFVSLEISTKKKKKKKGGSKRIDTGIEVRERTEQISSQAMASEADPMLQGTYLHDDAKDFVPTSVALDLFDARLASGQPVHSAHSPKRKYEPSQGVPVAEQHYNCAQKQQPSGKIFKNFDPPTGNNISSLTDEERERLEEIEAVRHLGNDSDDDNE